MPDKLNLVIVGCGMAAGKLTEELCKRAPSKYNISVFGDEKDGNYDRIRLTSVLQGKDVERFWINDSKWFLSNGISAYLGQTVTEIDRTTKTVKSNCGTCLSYDILVFATGSDAIIPSFKGSSLPGVFVLRNLKDAQKISAFIKDKQNITVMGGGILGLELADALLDMGKTVSVSHLMNSLMEQQFASEPAKVLESLLKQKNVTIYKENPITKLTQLEDGRLTAEQRDGTSFNTDALIINCGILPRIELAKQAELEIGRGIKVDCRLKTSDDSIFAIGECAEFEGVTPGLLAPVYAQASCLAAILCGDENITYTEGLTPSVKLKSSIAAVAMGKAEPEDQDNCVVYYNPVSQIYKRLIVRDNILVGASLVGDDLNADSLCGFYMSEIPLPKRVESLLFPGVKTSKDVKGAVYWPESTIVCDCNGVSCADIRAAHRKHKNDINLISEVSGAGRSCGTCLSRVASILDNTYDAIVVGAGLGGLTAAAKLAQHQKRVLVIEQHDKPGGYATSFTREGFTFDASLHNMGPLNSNVLRIFDNLDIMNSVEYIPYDSFQKIIFPKHNFVMEKGVSKFEEYLISNWPSEKQGIENLFEQMKAVRQGFLEIEDLTFESNSDDPISPLMAAKYPQFAKWIMTTLEELMDRFLKDLELKAVIGNIWWYFGLPPSETPSLLYSAVCLGYMEHAGGYIKGSSQQLSNALAAKINDNNGQILLNTKVTRILVSNDKAGGVITDEGELFYSDVVISNAGAYETVIEMIEETAFKKKYRNKILRQDNSLSAIQLYLGLDCSPDDLNLNIHSFTVFPTYDHDENIRMIREGFYEQTMYSCMLYSAVDSSLAPNGKAVMNIFSLDLLSNWERLSKIEYENKKAQVTEALIKKAEKQIPELSKHIIVKELGTPKTMNRYTGHREGSIYGPAQNIYQSGMNRLKAETPIQGLYLTGSSIYPGGGYPSVINSGYRTALAILRRFPIKDAQ